MDRAASEADDKRHRQVRSQFLWFLFFSVLEIGGLIWLWPRLSAIGVWFIVAGIILFLTMAVVSWRSMRNTWTAEQEDHAATRVLGYVFLGPVALVAFLVAFVLAGAALYSIFGWFATIPSWAAVIIVLLVLIYLK